MGTPTTWRDCSLSSAALERTEFYGGKVFEAHQSCPLPHHPVIGQSPALTVWPMALEASPPELVRSLPTIKLVRSIARELRRPSSCFVGDQLEIRI
jgi:hypothetical protein